MFSLKTIVWLVAGALLLSGASAVGGYFYGQLKGYERRVTVDEAAEARRLAQYQQDIADMLDAFQQRLLREWQDRMTVMDAVARRIARDNEVSNANAQALAAALRGRFELSPAERMRFECIRRPHASGCAADALRDPVP